MNDLNKLIEISVAIGKRVPFWIQGGGGNTSVKVSADKMYIKPSGFRLVDCASPDKWVEINLQKFLEKSPETEAEYGDIMKHSVTSTNGLRPSMETGFHALLRGQLIAHFHSIPAMLMGWECDRDEKKIMAWLQAELPKGKIVFIPTMMPGLNLMKAIEKHRDADVVFLKGHGVIMDVGKIPWEKWLEIEKKYCKAHGYHTLLAFLEEKPEQLPKKMHAYNPPTPWRVYFPDMSVFGPKVKGILQTSNEGSEKNYLFKAEANDGDLLELWQATCLLYHSTGDGFPQLNDNLQKNIVDLPSEKFRAGMK